MENTTHDRQVIDTPVEAQADETRTAQARSGATARSLANRASREGSHKSARGTGSSRSAEGFTFTSVVRSRW